LRYLREVREARGDAEIQGGFEEGSQKEIVASWLLEWALKQKPAPEKE